MNRSTFSRVAGPAACLASILLAAGPALGAGPAAFPRQLNDTGKIRCYQPVWQGGEIACAGTGQDGEHGRDVTDPRRFDGYAGFSYRKISSTGEALPASATEWACVQDRVTGLMWEVKTADGRLRDWQHTYTHLGNGQADDVSGFVRDVNQAGLCGHDDWRVPSRMELQSLVNYGHAAPMIINTWFPNTRASIHWTSKRQVGDLFQGHWIVSFQYGVVSGGGANENRNSARLVRGQPFPRDEHAPGRFLADGDKVTDTSTGLVWRRCAEGTTWTGTTCSGTAPRFTWEAALELARAADHDGAAWRLPNATELLSLVDDARFLPAIDTRAFPGMAQMFIPYFWSATPDLPGADGIIDAWYVEFDFGSLSRVSPTSTRAVRLLKMDTP